MHHKHLIYSRSLKLDCIWVCLSRSQFVTWGVALHSKKIHTDEYHLI